MYSKCSVVAQKVSEIIDREANFVTRFRFYTHLMICPKCLDYFRQYKLLKSAVHEPDPDQLPENFDNVMNFVLDEIEKKPTEDDMPANDPLKEN